MHQRCRHCLAPDGFQARDGKPPLCPQCRKTDKTPDSKAPCSYCGAPANFRDILVAVQEFVIRCYSGEVRSNTTFNKFKDLLGITR